MTIGIDPNDHRILSDLQQQWPARTLRNPDGSPLLAAAAALRGWLDILRLLLDRVLSQVPRLLEASDAYLVSLAGPRWWETAAFRGLLGGLGGA